MLPVRIGCFLQNSGCLVEKKVISFIDSDQSTKLSSRRMSNQTIIQRVDRGQNALWVRGAVQKAVLNERKGDAAGKGAASPHASHRLSRASRDVTWNAGSSLSST